MRIFKNRGDFYFSKTNKEKSNEQKILIFALVFIVVFTVVFLLITAVKNDFSAKEFFRPDDLEASNEYIQEEAPLPEVEGKTNFIATVNSEGKLLFVSLIQVDLDNLSYKCSFLRADTVYDGNTFSSIYSNSSAENLKTAVETLLNTSFDYYFDMSSTAFADFYDEMGKVSIPFPSEIKYKSNSSEVPYSVKIKAGEQSVSGTVFINLIRYYLDTESYNAANELMLNSMLQHMNGENLAKSEDLFNTFITSSESNISVRVFSLASDALEVLCDGRSAVKIYSAQAEYDGVNISKEGLKSIKGYFVK